MLAAVNVIAMTLTYQLGKENLHSFSKHIFSQSHFLLLGKQEPLITRKVPASVYLSLQIVVLSKMCYASIFGFTKDTYTIATSSQSALEI